MNLFVLDRDPFRAASFLCDNHTVCMGKEAVQMLCTVEHQYNGPHKAERLRKLDLLGLALYKPTHQNHPCVKWVGANHDNWWWATQHGLAIFAEYRVRYGRGHKSESLVSAFYDVLGSPFQGKENNREPSSFALAMPPHFQGSDPVESYRAFYKADKASFAKWERPGAVKPLWW